MYNSFIYKKHSQQLQKQHLQKRTTKQWSQHYKNSIRPALIQKYSRRINNFITRLEQDRKDFYQFRQETQSKALELLKQIDKKQRYLGDPNIKLRDNKDWSSILSPTERIDKERNRKIFQNKYGDSDIAYRSIASQSAYRPPDVLQFRNRQKDKEIHGRNMRFSAKARSFSQNSRDRDDIRSRLATQPPSSPHKTENIKQNQIKRTSSNHTYIDDDNKSQAYSIFSMGQHQKASNDGQSEVSNYRQPVVKLAQTGKKTNKVYFKQIVDLQQNSKDNTIKKSLHQILVRFGVSRIKDVKKQAMAETDNLEESQF